MKIIKILESKNALQKLLTMEMDIKKAYALRKYILVVNEKLQAFEETRGELIKKYWETLKDGNISVKQENIQKYWEELEQINEDIELEIPVLTIDDINGQIDTKTLIDLEFLIK